MVYEESLQVGKKPHQLILQERGSLTVSGVEEVESFDEHEVVMVTVAGMLVVRGDELHVGKLSLDTGELRLEGRVSELRYEENTRNEGFWARLFK